MHDNSTEDDYVQTNVLILISRSNLRQHKNGCFADALINSASCHREPLLYNSPAQLVRSGGRLVIKAIKCQYLGKRIQLV